MLLNPIPQNTWAALYPGRRMLFDIGTGGYKSGSLPWLTEVYQRRGVQFDDIFGARL